MAKHYHLTQRVNVGELVAIEVAFSEAAMWMEVAGTIMLAKVLEAGRMAQLYHLDGRPFSSPVTTGEAGFYEDTEGHYIHPPVLTDEQEAEVENTLFFRPLVEHLRDRRENAFVGAANERFEAAYWND